MKYLMSIALAIFLLGSCMDPDTSTDAEVENIQYPDTKKVDTVDNYFGTEVADPYRWLEDDEADEVAVWVEEQNKVTFDYLDNIPFRESIRQRLENIWDYPKYSAPFKEGNNYFFYKNDGLQNQSVLYVQEGLDGEPEVFLDPNKLSEDGTVALSSVSVSNDHQYLAYSTSASGSDWKEISVMNIETKEKMIDKCNWVKFSGISWYKNGYYYSRYDAPKEGAEYSSKNEFHKLYYHTLGTDQSNDELIYEDKEHAERNVYGRVTDDESYLLLYLAESTSGNMLMVKDLNTEGSDFVTLMDNFDHEADLVDHVDGKLLFHTNLNAPKWRLVSADPNQSGFDNWTDVLPEQEEVLRSVRVAGSSIYATYMVNAISKVRAYDFNGKFENEIEMPTIGTTGGISGKKGDNIAFYTFSSFTFPSTIYQYNTETRTSEIFRKSDIDFNADDYETNQVFYKSKDGTSIPMFIVHKKGIKMDGTNPTYLYGYGGFNISILPRFSLTRLILLENGGIYAQANLRGGGEFGEEWHEGGMLNNKQNVFDDFIAAAEYLIEEDYTSSDRLAISGRSNGGLLVGACMTQRPELYKVALPGVGVMDMLRFHKFTIGWAWVGEYGSSETEEHFKNLYSFSPLHNIKANVAYPATLVTTADHDDRVVPAHSFKFISTLQEHHVGEAPVMIRIDVKAGHGSGKPTSKIIDEWADIWSFVFYNLGVEPEYSSEVVNTKQQ